MGIETIQRGGVSASHQLYDELFNLIREVRRVTGLLKSGAISPGEAAILLDKAANRCERASERIMEQALEFPSPPELDT
jgi:hypothetical protein